MDGRGVKMQNVCGFLEGEPIDDITIMYCGAYDKHIRKTLAVEGERGRKWRTEKWLTRY